MSSLKELISMLKDIKSRKNKSTKNYITSLEKIPKFPNDNFLYFPDRPPGDKLNEYLNIMGYDFNVYPLLLDYFIKNDMDGSYFNLKPSKILLKFVGDFVDDEVLGAYGDGRSPRKILKIPLTLDYYNYFCGKLNGLELYLAFMLSYMLKFDEGVDLFSHTKRTINKFDYFSLNCPMAPVYTIQDIYYFQTQLEDVFDEIVFKEKNFVVQLLDSVVDNIIKENTMLKDCEILYANEIKVVEYCYECSVAKKCHYDDAQVIKGKWRVDDKKAVVLSKNFFVAKTFLNIISGSNYNNHDHVRDSGFKKGLYFYTIEDLLVFLFQKEGFQKEYIESMVHGRGLYIYQVPFELMKKFPFFSRTKKRIFIDWTSRLLFWYESLIKFKIIEEVVINDEIVLSLSQNYESMFLRSLD